MATPADIDPRILAQIQGQLGAPQAPIAPPAPLTPTEQMLSGGLQRAGVPQTQVPTPSPQAAPPPRVQGDFVNPQQTVPAWSPNMAMTKTPASAISTVSPETRKLYEAAGEGQRKAAEEIGTANEQAGQRQAAYLEQAAKELGAHSAWELDRRQQRTNALVAQADDYRHLQDEASSQKIDPRRGWSSKSGAEKALGIVGLILGAFGGMHNGGRNPAIDVLNKQIDDDIGAQKEEIAGKQRRADASRNIYEQKLRQFGDENAADLAARGHMLEQQKLYIQSEAARNGGQLALANAHAAVADISMKQAQIHQQMEHWQNGGIAGGITKEDAARATEFTKLGIPPEKALQMAMAMRGAAPTTGLPTLAGKGGKPNPEAASATELTNAQAPQALTLGERIEAGLANTPLIGRAFQGTSGARKELAMKAGSIPVMQFAHKGGARTPEQQREVAGSLIPQPSDSQERVNQKIALQHLVGQGKLDAARAAQIIGSGATAGEEEEDK